MAACGPRTTAPAAKCTTKRSPNNGIAVAALDFRQGAGGYPHSLIDINYAVRWVKANAARLKTRPDLVGIAGTSSGGHLAMLAAMRPNDPRYAAIPLPAGSPKVDASVRCVAMFWPVINPLGRHHNAKRLHEGANPPPWPPRTMQLSMAYWRTRRTWREGSPLLALERGEKVAMPPALWIQGTDDLIHDYRDPELGLRRHARRSASSTCYRRAGGKIDARILRRAAALHERPSRAGAVERALRLAVEFTRRHIPVK